MSKIKRFGIKQVDRTWNKDVQRWYITHIDFVEVFAESFVPKKYIKKARQRDKETQPCIR
jgi:hypothetical protein